MFSLLHLHTRRKSKKAAYHERAVRVLERCVGREDRVIGLHDRVRESRCGVNAELQLGLLAIVSRETFEDKSTEAGTSSTSERMEDKETLETGAIVCQAANFVHHSVNLLLSDRVVATSVCKQ